MEAHRSTSAPLDLRELLTRLRAAGELVEVAAEVDPELEAAEIHRRVIAAGGPALLFRRVRGADYPLVTNLFGTARRIDLAFGPRPLELVAEIGRLPQELLPPSAGALWRKRELLGALTRTGLDRRSRGAVLETVERPPRLSRLPALRTWKRDGGRFLTLPLVHTEHPEHGGSNLGMYRMQLGSDVESGMHVQIVRGAGFHLAASERAGRALAANVYLGGPPALMLAAIAPLPENVPELLLASLILGKKLALARNPAGPLPVVAEAEVALVGEIPAHERRPEGRFGDHYGYYSEVHDFPVFRCQAVLARRDAIVPATVVGKPRQEDFFLGDYLQELLLPLVRLVMPGVRDLWAYGETGYHSLAAAVVHERYAREAMTSAFRILGEGQLALTKFLLATDRPVELRDFPATLRHVLARARFETDLFVFANLAMDTLDYAGPSLNRGSKGVLLGLGEPVRALPREFQGTPAAPVRGVRVFTDGCLAVEGPSYASDPAAAARIAADPAFRDWPLLVLGDDAAAATRSAASFLWSTFTRFDPSADLHAAATTVERNHVAYRAPILIDARKKPSYPEELFCDDETAALVTRRWKEYFPNGRVAMGDSDRAHL